MVMRGQHAPECVTLDHARAQGAVGLAFTCCNGVRPPNPRTPGCYHRADLALADAIARWGGGRRLNAIPAVCSKCGSRKVDVRAFSDAGPGGMPKDWTGRPAGG